MRRAAQPHKFASPSTAVAADLRSIAMGVLWLVLEEVLDAVRERRRSWWPSILAVVLGVALLAVVTALTRS